MKVLILLIQFLLFTQSLFSQSLVFSDSTRLETGIYIDFEEFIFNKPSVEFNYKISESIRSTGINLNTDVIYYKLNINQQRTKELGNIFGFCDGKYVYVRENKRGFNSNTGFLKLENLGPYCYYEEIVRSKVYTGSSFTSTVDLLQIAINIILKEDVVLSNNKVKELIQSDSILLAEFNSKIPNFAVRNIQPREKIRLLKEYVIKYSEKHKNDSIFFDYLKLKDFNSILYKLKSDISFDDYYARILDFSSNTYFNKLEIEKTEYRNGNTKSIGIKAKHQLGSKEDYLYKIGTWRHFDKNGNLELMVDYNIRELLNGRYQRFNESGALIENRKFKNDIELY